MGAGEKLFDLAEAHTKWPGGATRRLVPVREQEELGTGAGLEQPAECFTSRERFLWTFFILQKKTGKLADWTEKISLVFCLF